MQNEESKKVSGTGSRSLLEPEQVSLGLHFWTLHFAFCILHLPPQAAFTHSFPPHRVESPA
jgi:hypothetical protein